MDPAPEDLEPIAGVDLRSFVAVSVELGRYQFDAARAAEVAAELGIDRDAWDTAARGWSERLRTSPPVAEAFERLYHRQVEA